jgi:hypothetical protein
MTRDKPAGRFGRWLAAFCASLLESSRMSSGADWTGWRVDWEVCSRHANARGARVPANSRVLSD